MKEKISTADKISLWISLIIPGFITSLVDFDISIFATYALVASIFGVKTVWLLLFVYLIVHVINGISGKIVIVADKGLVELIREYFGVKVSLVIFIATFLFNLLVIIQSYLALRIVSDIFRINFLLFALVFTLYLFSVFIIKLQRFTNRVFIFIALFYTSVFFIVFNNASSVLHTVISSKLTFLDLFRNNTSLYFLALLGATASAWNQLLVSRYTYKTKLNLDKLEYHNLDNRTSTLFSFLFSILFIGSIWLLFPEGSILNASSKTLARFIPLLQPVLRVYFFGIGLLFIVLTNIYAVSLSLSHVFTEFFGIERSDEEKEQFTKAHIYLFGFLVIPALLVTNILPIRLFNTALFFGFIQSFFVLILLYFLLYFSNNQTLMGRYKNDIFHNGVLIASGVCIILTFIIVFIKMLFHL